MVKVVGYGAVGASFCAFLTAAIPAVIIALLFMLSCSRFMLAPSDNPTARSIEQPQYMKFNARSQQKEEMGIHRVSV